MDRHSHNPNSDIRNSKAASTDMMPEFFATSHKLVPEEERQYYQPNQDPQHDLDDNIDDYVGGGNNQETRETRETKTDHESRKSEYESKRTDGTSAHYTETSAYGDERTDTHTGTHANTDKKSSDDNLTHEELILKKLDMLRKLGELTNAGVKLSQNYNLNSDLKMMKYEYELHKNIRSKQNSINWMSSMSLNAIYGIEMLNEKYNPFDLKLKGWSEQMNADVDNYYDVFGELYEKYSSPTQGMAPELKLLLMMSGSALKFHLSSHVINSMPNLNDMLDKDPNLMEQFRSRAATAEKQKSELNSKLNKEHELAAQMAATKTADLKMIREKELEFLTVQKQLAEKRAQLEQLRQGLSGSNAQTQTQTQAQTLARPNIPADLENILGSGNQQIPPRENMQQMSIERQRLEQQQQKIMQERQKLEQEKAFLHQQRINQEQAFYNQQKMYQQQMAQSMAHQPIAAQSMVHQPIAAQSMVQSNQTSHQSPKEPQRRKPKAKSETEVSNNIKLDTELEREFGGLADSEKSNKSAGSVMSVNPKIFDIFAKKKETGQTKKPKATDKVVSIETVDKDDITCISLGSRRSNRSNKARQGQTN